MRITRLTTFLLLLTATAGCGLIGYSSRSHTPSRPLYHQVQAGETLFGIGRHYGMSQARLQLLNKIHDPRELRVGQRLLVGYRAPSGRNVIPGLSSEAGTMIYYTDGILTWPVAGGGRLVSRFGPRSSSFHDGLDIADESGTEVLAAHDGTVIYSDNEVNGYGNLVIVRNRSGLMTVYAHNRKLLVDRGDHVKRGQQIAEVGSTGHASGPHLHFEVRTRDRNNRYVAVDPLPLFSKQIGKLPRYRVNENLTPILAKLR